MKSILTILLFLACFFCCLSAKAQNRDADPVVLKGSAIPCMTGTSPASIVAFKFNGTNWVQIPVQIDEMVIKDIKAPYGPNNCVGPSNLNIDWNIPFYADANTFTGADTDPSFDNDDELVFMAKDAGSRTTNCNYPNGTLPNTLCELTVKDPLTNTVWGYVYLFRQNGTLNPSANISYVNCNFTFANNYINSFNVCSGSNNNENSTVTTSRYFMRYTGKWIEEELKITAGNSTGVDILDRHQAFVAIDNCFRSENTFSNAEGPFVTGKSGPVRAIRSLMGANSGIFTQITILFTESRVDYIHNFRVHPIGGFYDVFDLNANAIGMQYYNNQNQAGVTINGVQDNINTTNYNLWELYTGAQGSLAVTYDYKTDMTIGTAAQVQAGTADAALDAYYDDAGSNAAHKCTGDKLSYGSSGFHLVTNKCTDRRRPDNGCGAAAKTFTNMRYHYILPPNASITNAVNYRSFVMNPLTAVTGGCPSCIVPAETHTAILCNGGTSIVTISASGGTPPYTGTGTFSQSASTQSYTVTDATGCSNSIAVTITEPSLLVPSETHTSITCNGGTSTVTINASGGTAPYTGTGAFSQSAGTQSYTVTDANGCSKSILVSITEPSLLTLSKTHTSITCNGGTSTVTIIASGGTTPYTGTGTFSQSTGTKNYTVTDANGCRKSISVSITEPSLLTLSETHTTIACSGGTSTVTINAIGGTAPYTGTGTFSQSAGTKNYTVTDANGCNKSISISINEPTLLVVSEIHTSIVCNGGTSTVTINASGGTAPYTGTGIFSQSTGTKSYTVTDANGCSKSISVSVIEPSLLLLSETHTPIACNGSSSTVTISASAGTAPYTGTGTFSQTAGTKNYTVTDANGCSKSISVTVNDAPVQVPAQPSVISGNTQPPPGIQKYSVVSVIGVSYNWTISGGGTITTNGNNADINWTTPGSYSVSVIPFNSCGNGTVQTVTVIVQTATSVSNISGNENIIVTPNPVLGSLFIFNRSNRKLFYYQVFSSAGIQVQSGTMAPTNNTSIELSVLASGMYILVLSDSRHLPAKRFIFFKN